LIQIAGIIAGTKQNKAPQKGSSAANMSKANTTAVGVINPTTTVRRILITFLNRFKTDPISLFPFFCVDV
jgi:hypothetical protein